MSNLPPRDTADQEPQCHYVDFLDFVYDKRISAQELAQENPGFLFELDEIIDNELFKTYLLAPGDISDEDARAQAVELLIPLNTDQYTRYLLRPHVINPCKKPGFVEVNDSGVFKLGDPGEYDAKDFGWLDPVAVDPDTAADGDNTILKLLLHLNFGNLEFEIQPMRGTRRFEPPHTD